MMNEEFLRKFTDLVREAFERQGPDMGELLISAYLMMATARSVREDAYEELRRVFEKLSAASRVAYDNGEPCGTDAVWAMKVLQESGVWRLARRRPNGDWPDEI